MRIVLRIATRNLLHGKRRLVASAAGVCFSVTLVTVQLGLFTGLAANSSQIIDHSPGQIWVTGRNTRNFQWGQPIPARTLSVVRSTPGIAWASEIIMSWASLHHPDGGAQKLQVVGFDPFSQVGAPWNLVAGSLRSLTIPGRIVLDQSAMEKVGEFKAGDYREISGHRVRIAAVTRDITSFTTVPLVFSSLETARKLVKQTVGPDETVYVVAGLASGASLAPAIARLRLRLPHLDVFSKAAFSSRTRRYWMFETGMGIGFLLTSLLAIAVGTVIVSQAIFAATSEHLTEYGTLKAIGMGNTRLGAIVTLQGVMAALAGALPGSLIGAVVVEIVKQQGLAAVFAPRLCLFTVLAALLASALAALGSVIKVWKVEPAMVYRQ